MHNAVQAAVNRAAAFAFIAKIVAPRLFLIFCKYVSRG
jgi:hypothetical protein